MRNNIIVGRCLESFRITMSPVPRMGGTSCTVRVDRRHASQAATVATVRAKRFKRQAVDVKWKKIDALVSVGSTNDVTICPTPECHTNPIP